MSNYQEIANLTGIDFEQKEAGTSSSDQEHNNKLLKELGTKSSVIRYLTAEGWKRGRIAKSFTPEIRYQHVRNVQLEQAKKSGVK